MIRLSKSKYVAGLQCPKLLWLSVHEPKAPELVPDESLQALFDVGHRVTAKAREGIPGGVLIEASGGGRRQQLAATRRAIDDGAQVIYEAAFEHQGVLVLVDILEKSRRGWTLIEVKSSTGVKPEHHPDAAVQQWVVEGAGLRVARVELMHLNRECRYPDLSNLFVREDVSDEIAEAIAEVPRRVRQMKKLLAEPLPTTPIGEHCSTPRACAFVSRCWVDVPRDSVHSLYRVRKARAFELWNDGVERIANLPSGVRLSTVQQRQKHAIETGEMMVDPGLAEALQSLKKPAAYLDFETIWPAIPTWDGLRPYDQVAVQVSVHTEDRDGSVFHSEWLAAPNADPREAIARKTLEFTERTGSVVVYNAAFERARIRELMERFPAMARDLESLSERLWDLLPVVRNHVYHPDFNGSFSLKSVLPALVPGESYDGMEIAEGGSASRVLERVLFDPEVDDAERESMRRSLLQYCRQDTLSMVRLVGRLRALAAR